MMDCSRAKIAAYTRRFRFPFWQLRSPLTKYALAGVPYGLDNGCFKTFHRGRWERLVRQAHTVAPVFVALPDVVGDAARTGELFEHFKAYTIGLPRALVLQDGIEHQRIPWDDVAAVFVGGTTEFKMGRSAFAAAHTAKLLGKWVHVGRVNTPDRVRAWLGKADSIDGSGLSRYDHMLRAVLQVLREGD